MDVSVPHPRDPDVIATTTGLVSFLREVVKNGTQRTRDCRDKPRELLWLADLPQGMRRPSENDEVLLSLDYAPVAAAPELPDVLDGWVEAAAIQDPDAGDPPLAQEGPALTAVEDERGGRVWEQSVVRREDAAEVLRAYGPWLERWRRWAGRERIDRIRRECYALVWRWHQQLAQQDDQRELVVAVGLLTWRDADGSVVHRHVLTQRVQTAVERRTARLTVRLAPESALRVEDQDFLDSDDGWDPERAVAVCEELEAQSPHPLSQLVLEQLVQWQERALGRPVASSAEWAAPDPGEPGARLTLAPALVMRPRDGNALLRCYDQIGAGIVSDGQAPLGLAQLVLPLEAKDRARWQSVEPLLGDDPLFPLKTNAQQRAVLKRLESGTGVVVQGPPGTGKTHTIANLVSALLAQGKRVLVTSARDQPLSVLRDKLPPQIRDLCVLLLSSTSQDGVSERERTINTLTEQVAASDSGELKELIARLSQQRAELRGRIAAVTDRVVELREAEIVPHGEVAPGYAGTLAVLVELIARSAETCGWIGTLPPDAPDLPPLDGGEAAELLALLAAGALSGAEPGWLPDPLDVPSVEEVRGAVEAANDPGPPLAAAVTACRDVLARLRPELVQELAAEVAASVSVLHRLGLDATMVWDAPGWQASALADRLAPRPGFLWQRVTSGAGDLGRAREGIEQLGMRRIFVPSGLPHDRVERMANAAANLAGYLRQSKKLKSWRPGPEQREADEVLVGCLVDGSPARSEDTLSALSVHLRAQAILATLVSRWQAVGVSIAAAEVEVQIAQLADLYARLELVEEFAAIRTRIDTALLGAGTPVPLGSAGQWNDFTQAMRALDALHDGRAAAAQLDAWRSGLLAGAGGRHPAEQTTALAQALAKSDVDAYRACFEAVGAAHAGQARRRRAAHLIGRLREAHPSLAVRLEEHPAHPTWQDRLADLPRAWAWAVAHRYVQQQRVACSEQHLDRELEELEQRLEQITGELAGAWGRLHCVDRMTLKERSMLQAYRAHMSSYGRGSGRQAGKFKAAAREAMTKAMGAVPAWVMPIGQVAEMLPAQRDAFDVLIVDEASQASMESLFLLWLAPRVIVVGDDQQCAPSVTGMGRHQVIEDRLSAHLPDLPLEMRQLYTPHTNLYQLLSTFFPDVIRLTEHFRCMPEIITWSSRTFYDNALVPLRQFGGERPQPLVTHFVEGAEAIGRESRLHNPKEAEAIVDLLAQLVEDPDYRERTIGVIVLQGSRQIAVLEDLIQQRIPNPAQTRHNIRVGNAASFQGDERHVIILSMVVSDPARIWGGQRSEQQSYNVAASRAQDQMHLFHSVPRDRLKPKDLRLNLLAYMQNPPGVLADAGDIGPVYPDVPRAPFESLFEQQVYLHIKERGYHVIPQFPAGRKRIDLVVVGAKGRMGIECDGDHFHSTPQQIRHDQQRERELGRVGWQFWRVRESEFRYDPQVALASLWSELDQHGIHPAHFDAAQPTAVHPDGAWQPLALLDGDTINDDSDLDAAGPEDGDETAAPSTRSTLILDEGR